MSGALGPMLAKLGGGPQVGAELECLGLILGHPFLEKFGYKSGRQMCGLCPPLLGSKHSRSPGDGPKHPGPPQLFIPGLPLLLRPGPASQSMSELGSLSRGSRLWSQQRASAAGPLQPHWGLGTLHLATACPLQALGLADRKSVHGGQGLGRRHGPWVCSNLLHDCGHWLPIALATSVFSRRQGAGLVFCKLFDTVGLVP